jgi:hypothetical protein
MPCSQTKILISGQTPTGKGHFLTKLIQERYFFYVYECNEPGILNKIKCITEEEIKKYTYSISKVN